MKTSTCSKCKQEKPRDRFHTTARGRPNSWCKDCNNQKNREIRKGNQKYLAAQRAQKKKFYVDNREKMKEKDRMARFRKYGITKEIYEDMLKEQGNCCAICTDSFGDSTPHIDHCHASGRVRQLLCNRCNSGIGMLRDDVDILRSAIDYLTRHKYEDKLRLSTREVLHV